MTDLRCPACRHPVDVPEDHLEATIHCGICWADVALGDRMVPVALIAAPVSLLSGTIAAIEENVQVTPPPHVKTITDPFKNIPGFPVKGHGSLEDVLRRVVERVPAFLATTTVKTRVDSIIPADIAAQLPPLAKALPTLPEIETRKPRHDARREDDDLRRPRRPLAVAQRLPNDDEDDEPDRRDDEERPSVNSRIGGQIAILLGFLFMAALAFYVVQTLIK